MASKTSDQKRKIVEDFELKQFCEVDHDNSLEELLETHSAKKVSKVDHDNSLEELLETHSAKKVSKVDHDNSLEELLETNSAKKVSKVDHHNSLEELLETHSAKKVSKVDHENSLEELLKTHFAKKVSKVDHDNSLEELLEAHFAKKVSKVDHDNSLEELLETHSAKKVSKCDPKPPSPEDAITLLEKLGLLKYYPEGLHLQNALCIKEEPLMLSLKLNDKKCPTDYQKLPFLVLHKLMAYDSLCRSDLMSVIDLRDHPQSDSEESGSDSDSSYDCGSQSLSNSFPTVDSGIHPVDCLLSLIICSDDFLRQDLFSRLAKCQLAVPFILPDPFTKKLILPLWCLRSIIKEWECIKEKGEDGTITQSVISYNMPIVTFIRIGKHQKYSRSKSAILNEVISDSHYDHFFHRDCHGGSHKLVLGDGLVDMCWYLPGKTADAFPDAVTFLNLHGDAREHPEQMQFLSQISSMCFVLLTEENLELDDNSTESLKQFSLSMGGITVLGSIESIPKCLMKKVVIDLEKNNVFGIKDLIRKRIKRKLDHSKTFQSINDCCLDGKVIKKKIIIDENSEAFTLGFINAIEIAKLIASHHQSSLARNQPTTKDVSIPLQGEDLWRAWAAKNKEMQRQIQRGDKSVNEYTEEIKQEKVAIRKKQLKHLESLTPIMNSFIASLLKFGGNPNRIPRNYFLQCLKLELDNFSRECISSMQHRYHSSRNKLSHLQQKLKQSQDDSGEIESLKIMLENLQQNIIDSSFGLEHLLREFGQVYEAALESQLYGMDSLLRLPKAAAELLIDGYPLELMDGDAAHVPLQWVTAVLAETTKMLGDPNVFVLSVLGLQSTGKSTMLNTVFGLQFHVSAGRCTRGAFMQLLPLDDELKSRTKFSYVLVVDTEGLRAPQLDPLKTLKHDNELATFVIGLANLTLINIYGEVPGDMDDILQTSVHAFLRMTQIKLNPHCHFIHHNAGVSVSSDVGRVKFIEKLDQITITAAKQEHCEKKFKCFNDVIKFNTQSDVHYFPGLWKGDPPMAPVNEGYSQSAQKLKHCLIDTLKTISNLSDFQQKLQDLWKALLKENFVFSFKNAQEIVAYNMLEAEYSKWDWELREAMLKWELVAENEISAAKMESARALTEQKLKELQKHTLWLSQPIQVKLKVFFSRRQSEILAQWKAKFERRLKDHIEKLKQHAITYCLKLCKNKETIFNFEQSKQRFAAKITGQVHNHIAAVNKEQEQLSICLKCRKVDSEHMNIILKRNIFTKESLEGYRRQGIITEEQLQSVQEIIDSCSGQLTETDLEKIMFEEVLELEQIKKILAKARQSERELETKFDGIWDELIQQLLPVSVETVNVEKEVEKTLFEFVDVHAQGNKGQLTTMLQDKNIREWGTKLALSPHEGNRYNKAIVNVPRTGPFLSYVWPGGESINNVSDPHRTEAVKVTEAVFDKVHKLLNDIVAQGTNFNAGYTQRLLFEAEQAITTYSETDNIITFTVEYQLTIFLIVCGYAIPQFEKMAESFKEQTDPRLYLEKHVKKLEFTKFKNQHYQTEAEEAIANTLCVLLEVQIKDQIKKTIGAKVVSKMKSSKGYLSSKMALKVKILTDIYEEDTYEGYMEYVQNVKECIQNRLKQYIVQYADERVSDESTLQEIVHEEVRRLITIVEHTVAEVNENDIQKWLTTFSTNPTLVSELGRVYVDNLLTGFDSLNEMDLGNFKYQVRVGLKDLQTVLHSSYDTMQCEEYMTQWKDNPYDLLKDLIGCTEQCPFCGEQCDLLDPNHFHGNDRIKHRAEVHRPSCLKRIRSISTRKLATDFCTSLVSSRSATFQNDKTNRRDHLFNQYARIYPEWSIPRDPTAEASLYWKSFVARYSENLAQSLDSNPPQVPRGWHNIQWPEVKRSLEDAYGI